MTSPKRGRAFLLKVSNGDGYTTVAGMRETGFVSEGPSVSVAGAGIFLGSAAEATVRDHALSGSLADYELSYETGDRLRGQFQVQRLTYAGDFNGERNYEISLLGTAQGGVTRMGQDAERGLVAEGDSTRSPSGDAP